jgi:DNA-binding MarR family transcriptional regulator
MVTPVLNEREFELINIIGADLGANQRDLSRRLNLSLGMTNMLIRRLISKGYIRIHQLNKRKVEYILTPQGFSEKMRKSVKYTLKTIRSISLIKERLREILAGLVAQGTRKFMVLGNSDLASLIDIILRENYEHTCVVQHITEIPAQAVEGVILIC